ncbi:MAG: nitrogen fixation protein NifH [Candidatus Thermoplasmatota archaeon]|nr:nitrogen fixation protein NifH [Candidatus Thermoplasmatota archaeon]
MAGFRSLLNADSIEWLLEKDETNPSVRYFAMRDLLGKPESDREVIAAKKAIMKTGPVPKILAKQKPGGYWGKPEEFYVNAKYKGTVWNTILLAELGADGKDRRIRKACEFILEYSQDRESGAFSHRSAAAGGGSREVIPCLTGNMIWALIRFGYLKDPRVQRGIEWITRYVRFDDGETCAPSEWPYKRFKSCWGKHTCFMGVVKCLNALAEIPEEKRTADIRRTISDGAEFLLAHHVYKRSHDISKLIKPFWTKFFFPLMWNTDALDIFGLLARLGYKDERMKDAAELIFSKQDENGCWKLERTYNDEMLVRIEKKGRQSKWITLNALAALKRFYS